MDKLRLVWRDGEISASEDWNVRPWDMKQAYKACLCDVAKCVTVRLGEGGKDEVAAVIGEALALSEFIPRGEVRRL